MKLNALTRLFTGVRLLATASALTLLVALFASHAFAAGVTLIWDEPTTNVDGTPLTDLARIFVYQDGVKVKEVEATKPEGGGVGSAVLTVDEPAQGKVVTYSFHATAVDKEGNESGPSNTVTKTLDKQPPGQLKKFSVQ